MKRRLIAFLTVILTGMTALYAQNKDILVEMKTTEGTVVLRLFGDTPQHQANFVKLAREGYYDGLLFHRVIDRFMVQAGDPDSRNAAKGALLGSGSPDYTIPAEITYPRHFHKRGALAAAREGDETNPEWRSSGSQFYIVTGRRYTPVELDRLEMKIMKAQKGDGLKGFTPEIIEEYTTNGGAAHLDASYTVFGQVEKGYDIVDRIQKTDVDENNRPVEDIKIISMKVLGEAAQ